MEIVTNLYGFRGLYVVQGNLEGPIKGDLVCSLPEHLLPQSLCFWVNWSKCVFVPASANGSVLLGAPREGVIKSKKLALSPFLSELNG